MSITSIRQVSNTLTKIIQIQYRSTVNFYKLRAYTFAFVARILGRIFVVEIPPIVSVSALIEKNGKLLFLDYSYLKGYGLPGGLVNINEDLESALAREVKEETGLDVTGSTYFTSTASFHKKLPLVSATFIVRVSGLEKASREGRLVWLDPSEAQGKMAYAGTEVVLGKYMNRK